MALNPLDPAMKLLYSLDESGATATRLNSGQLGTDLNLIPVTASSYDATPANRTRGVGCPTVAPDHLQQRRRAARIQRVLGSLGIY